MMWPFIGLITLVSISEKRLNYFDLLLLAAPLIAYYIAAYNYNDFKSINDLGIFWNLTYDMSLASKPYFYPLKGIVESFFQGDFRSITKALLMLLTLLICCMLSFFAWQKRNYFFLSLVLPIILLMLIIGEFTSAAALRHSKFILIPMAAYLDKTYLKMIINDKNYLPIAFLLVFSQLVFTWNIFIGF